jgi:anti-sigma regulatory factor (Ser/Thr protein kinase)
MDQHIKLEVKLPKVTDIKLVALEGLALMWHHFGITKEKIEEVHILVTEGIINAFEHYGSETPYVIVGFTMTKNIF